MRMEEADEEKGSTNLHEEIVQELSTFRNCSL